MPVSDRTTIELAFEALLARLQSDLVADPPTADRPFRQVLAAPVADDTRPGPVLGATIRKMTPVDIVDDDKMWSVETTLDIVVDEQTPQSHRAVVRAVAAVEDHLDGLRDSGILEGAEGFDDRSWTLDYPTRHAGPRVVRARAVEAFLVKVRRQQNRVPAAATADRGSRDTRSTR